MVMWGSKLIGNGGEEMSILQCNVRAGHKWHQRTFKALRRFSCTLPVMLVQGKQAWLYSDGQEIATWNQRDFIRLGSKRGKLAATVIPRAEVIKSEADEVAWTAQQAASIEVVETDPEFARKQQLALAEPT